MAEVMWMGMALFVGGVLVGVWLGQWNYSSALRYYLEVMEDQPERGIDELCKLLKVKRHA